MFKGHGRLISAIRRNARNIFSLYLLQGANAVAPVVIYPFLLSRLGVELFSDLVFLEVLALLCQIVSMYSFDVNGIFRLAKEDAKHVFISVLYARLFLFGACAVVFTSLVVWFMQGQNVYAFAIFLLLPLGNILQSFWYHQAVENNWVNSIFMLVGRLLFLVLIFVFVSTQNDFLLAVILLAMSCFIPALCSLVYVMARDEIRFCRFVLFDVFAQCKEGVPIFISNLGVGMFKEFNILIIKLAGVPAEGISLYAIAEKFVKAMHAINRPISQALYPKIIRFVADGRRNLLKGMSRFILPQIMVLILLGVFSGLAAYGVSKVIPGLWMEYRSAVFLFWLMSLSIVFGLINFVYGVAGLNALAKEKLFASIVVAVGMVNVPLCYFASMIWAEYGAGLVFVFSELLLSVLVISLYMRFYMSERV